MQRNHLPDEYEATFRILGSRPGRDGSPEERIIWLLEVAHPKDDADPYVAEAFEGNVAGPRTAILRPLGSYSEVKCPQCETTVSTFGTFGKAKCHQCGSTTDIGPEGHHGFWLVELGGPVPSEGVDPEPSED